VTVKTCLAIPLDLLIGFGEVGVRAFVLPGEGALFPDVGPALAAALLVGAFLEGQAAVAVLAGGLVAEQPAQIDEMFLGDTALFAGLAAPFADELLGRKPWRHRQLLGTWRAGTLPWSIAQRAGQLKGRL